MRNGFTANINEEKVSPKKVNFFGRSEELGQILRALGREQGSTTLISGDRGSGKTTLIDQATTALVESRKKRLSFKLLGIPIPKRIYATTIVLKVPLIPPNTDKQLLKGIILRSIIHTLIADRTFKKAFIYPMTYPLFLRRLKKLTIYKSITKESGWQFGYRPTSFIPGETTGSLTKFVKSELDLSDIRIELELSNFFRKYSKLIKFVIVFDETDKYEGKENSLAPHDFIFHTKNLFTTTGAHFIFVSTEDYYHSLTGEIRNGRREVLHTLFTNTVLINQMSPNDFIRSLRDKLFDLDDLKSNSEYNNFEHAMMWSSNMYPFEQIKQLSELPSNNASYFTYAEAVSYYADDWYEAAALQALIVKLFNANKKDKDGYFNRYLYKYLREMIRVILAGTTIDRINRDNLASVIFLSEAFVLESEKLDFLDNPLSHKSAPNIKDSKSWKLGLFELPQTELDTIELAIEDLFWHLDRLGILSAVRLESEQHISFDYHMSSQNGTYEYISSQLVLASRVSSDERHIIVIYKSAFEKYKNLYGLDANEFLPQIKSISRAPDGSIVLSDQNYRFKIDLHHDIEALGEYNASLNHHFISTLEKWTTTIFKNAVIGNETNYFTVSDRDRELIVIENPNQNQLDELFVHKVKVVAVYSNEVQYKTERRNKLLKKVFVSDNFDNFQTALRQSKNTITKYFAN